MVILVTRIIFLYRFLGKDDTLIIHNVLIRLLRLGKLGKILRYPPPPAKFLFNHAFTNTFPRLFIPKPKQYLRYDKISCITCYTSVTFSINVSSQTNFCWYFKSHKVGSLAWYTFPCVLAFTITD